MPIDTLILLNNDYRREILGKMTILFEEWMEDENKVTDVMEKLLLQYNDLIDNENNMVKIEQENHDRARR